MKLRSHRRQANDNPVAQKPLTNLDRHFDGDYYADDVIKSGINIREDVMLDEEQHKLKGKIKSKLQ